MSADPMTFRTAPSVCGSTNLPSFVQIVSGTVFRLYWGVVGSFSGCVIVHLLLTEYGPVQVSHSTLLDLFPHLVLRLGLLRVHHGDVLDLAVHVEVRAPPIPVVRD